MGLRRRAFEALGLVTESQLKEERSRAYEQGFYDANDDPQSGDIAAGGFGYKRISDNYVREGKIDFQRALETSWDLWQKSPIAKRVLAMKRDHIIGHSAMPTTDDKALSDLLTSFWSDNKLDKRSSEFAMQLFGMGEQCYPVFVRESDGRVRLGYIDPSSIIKVIKHPDNALEDWAVCVRRESTGLSEKRIYRIIREDESFVDEERAIDSEYEGMLVTAEQATLEPWEERMLREQKGLPDNAPAEYDGSCFYEKVNAVSNQGRGMGDLLQVGDWIEQADNVLFALADREEMAGWFAFDVTFHDADEAQVKKRLNEIAKNPPKKGSVNGHNDSEEWNQWAPELGQGGTVETFRAILGLILGGMGFPVHWYGFGDDANRATAVAQGAPTEKSLEHDQGTVRDLFLRMCQFAWDQAVIAGQPGVEQIDDDAEITLNLPEVTARDLSRITTSLGALAQALLAARDSGWISQQKAAEAWAKVMGELGVELDPAMELEAAAEEQAERERQRAEQRANALQQMGQNGDGPEEDDEEEPSQDDAEELLRRLGMNV